MKVKRWAGRRVWSTVTCCVPKGTEGIVICVQKERAVVQWFGGPREIVDADVFVKTVETTEQHAARRRVGAVVGGIKKWWYLRKRRP